MECSFSAKIVCVSFIFFFLSLCDQFVFAVLYICSSSTTTTTKHNKKKKKENKKKRQKTKIIISKTLKTQSPNIQNTSNQFIGLIFLLPSNELTYTNTFTHITKPNFYDLWVSTHIHSILLFFAVFFFVSLFSINSNFFCHLLITNELIDYWIIFWLILHRLFI